MPAAVVSSTVQSMLCREGEAAEVIRLQHLVV